MFKAVNNCFATFDKHTRELNETMNIEQSEPK